LFPQLKQARNPHLRGRGHELGVLEDLEERQVVLAAALATSGGR
jgi:hypothetical protein